MHALKWLNEPTRMFFMGDGGPGGGGGGEAPSSSGGGGDSGGGGTSAPASSPGGGSGATPPAAPTPSATPAATPSTPDWSSLGSVDDLDYQQEIPPEPTPVEGEPKPEPTPVVPPPPQAAPTPQAQVPPAAAPPTPGEGEARPLTAAEPWRIAEGLEANRDAIMAHLAQAKFALSEADIKEIDTDVVGMIPKIMARVFLESQVSMQKFLAQAVPGMLKQYNSVSSANDAAEKEFFSTHKALDINNAQHRATAIRIATVYRQANPNIPLKQLIQEVGPMVMAALQINGVRPPAGGNGAALPRGAGAFRPAVPGGGGHSPAPEPENEWAGLGREYD